MIAGAVNKLEMLSDKILRLRFTDAVLPEWVLYWLRAESGRGEIQRLSTGNQESMRNIGQDQIPDRFELKCHPYRIKKVLWRKWSADFRSTEELTNEVEANLKRVERLRWGVSKNGVLRNTEGWWNICPNFPTNEAEARAKWTAI